MTNVLYAERQRFRRLSEEKGIMFALYAEHLRNVKKEMIIGKKKKNKNKLVYSFAGTGLQPVSKCFLCAQDKIMLQNKRNGLQTRSRAKFKIQIISNKFKWQIIKLNY